MQLNNTYRTPALGLRAAGWVFGGHITMLNAALHVGIAIEGFVFHTHWSRLGCLWSPAARCVWLRQCLGGRLIVLVGTG